jgi:hypothetical protein
MNKDKIETILKVGAAGGSLTLFGSKYPTGQWKFFTERNETTTHNIMSEEDREGLIPVSRTSHVNSIKEGLLLLKKYPWFRLFPLEVHPEFQKIILAEVKRLGGKSEIDRWKRYLKIGPMGTRID